MVPRQTMLLGVLSLCVARRCEARRVSRLVPSFRGGGGEGGRVDSSASPDEDDAARFQEAAAAAAADAEARTPATKTMEHLEGVWLKVLGASSAAACAVVAPSLPACLPACA